MQGVLLLQCQLHHRPAHIEGAAAGQPDIQRLQCDLCRDAAFHSYVVDGGDTGECDYLRGGYSGGFRAAVGDVQLAAAHITDHYVTPGYIKGEVGRIACRPCPCQG